MITQYLKHRARRFWCNGKNAYFDARTTNTNSQLQSHIPTENMLIKNKKEKKRQFNRRNVKVEHITFTPLVDL